MKLTRIAAVLPLALALSTQFVPGTAPVASAATAHMAAMTVTKTGTFEKLVTGKSFLMKVGMHSYTVKVTDMTHVTVDAMKSKISALKKGQKVTVKGELEMGTIVATSVTAGM
jgi:hypothetical protein